MDQFRTLWDDAHKAAALRFMNNFYGMGGQT